MQDLIFVDVFKWTSLRLYCQSTSIIRSWRIQGKAERLESDSGFLRSDVGDGL